MLLPLISELDCSSRKSTISGQHVKRRDFWKMANAIIIPREHVLMRTPNAAESPVLQREAGGKRAGLRGEADDCQEGSKAPLFPVRVS